MSEEELISRHEDKKEIQSIIKNITYKKVLIFPKVYALGLKRMRRGKKGLMGLKQ